MPFELARSLFALGAIQRRMKQKAEAKRSLARALAMFQELGTSLCVDDGGQ
jgi:hypothetical protein